MSFSRVALVGCFPEIIKCRPAKDDIAFIQSVEAANTIFLVAGTGKSLLLRTIIAALRKKYAGKTDAVAVTASTGMAASNIGGESATIQLLPAVFVN